MPPKQEQPEATDPLIQYFEGKGYTNVRRSDAHNIHEIFFATKDGEECFIKKYAGPDAKAAGKVNAELLCYQQLPQELLIEVVEINPDERYLVLRKLDLRDIEKSEQSLDDIIALYFEKLAPVDASSLPEGSWDDYEQMFEKIQSLESANVSNNAQSIIDLFKRNRTLIEQSPNVFSHGDFNLRNIKKDGTRLVVLDFEHAQRDNAMKDMAALYTSIANDAQLSAHFQDVMRQRNEYNETLFDLMVIRRCVLALNTYKDSENSQDFFKKNLELLKSTLEKYQ